MWGGGGGVGKILSSLVVKEKRYGERKEKRYSHLNAVELKPVQRG